MGVEGEEGTTYSLPSPARLLHQVTGLCVGILSTIGHYRLDLASPPGPPAPHYHYDVAGGQQTPLHSYPASPQGSFSNLNGEGEGEEGSRVPSPFSKPDCFTSCAGLCIVTYGWVGHSNLPLASPSRGPKNPREHSLIHLSVNPVLGTA